jgi:uncharacterized membrane protein YqjE
MDPNVPAGSSAPICSAAESFPGWIATLVLYAELRLRLLGLEAKEAGLHLLILALLLVSAVVFLAGFLVMLVVFFLYLLMTVFHWEWGWSALACAGVALITSIISGVIFRSQINKPLFPTTFAEFQKDREWLTQTTINSE